jgi:hypothetical protein
VSARRTLPVHPSCLCDLFSPTRASTLAPRASRLAPPPTEGIMSPKIALRDITPARRQTTAPMRAPHPASRIQHPQFDPRVCSPLCVLRVHAPDIGVPANKRNISQKKEGGQLGDLSFLSPLSSFPPNGSIGHQSFQVLWAGLSTNANRKICQKSWPTVSISRRIVRQPSRSPARGTRGTQDHMHETAR